MQTLTYTQEILKEKAHTRKKNVYHHLNWEGKPSMVFLNGCVSCVVCTITLFLLQWQRHTRCARRWKKCIRSIHKYLTIQKWNIEPPQHRHIVLTCSAACGTIPVQGPSPLDSTYLLCPPFFSALVILSIHSKRKHAFIANDLTARERDTER